MRKSRSVLSVFNLVVIYVLAICTNASAHPKALPTGTWGGDHIIMTVNAQGADIDFDCAVGSIGEPVTLDANGRFTLRGIYKAESPAPVSASGGAGNEAVYSGTLKGESLHLEISVVGRSQHLSFDLKYNQSGNITKCA
jgi:hypothetical protein